MNYATNYNDRLFVRLKYDYEITKYLKVKTNFGFERQKVTEPTQYSSVEFWQGLIWPVFMPYNSKGHLYNFGSHENPIGYARDSGNTTDYNYRINSMIGLVLTPVKNLNITAELSSSFDILENQWAALGFDMYDENDKFSYNSRNFRNAAGTAFQRIMYNVANVYANYKFTLAEKNNFDFMAGYSHEEDDTHKFTAERRLGLISPELPTMAMGSSTEQYNGQEKYDRALNSFFSRLSYSYDNRYFIEGIFRYDGSSKFAKGHKWSPFGGISGAWNISNERFMSEINHIINFLKIRASWGKIGNEASIGYYDYLALINIGGSYPIGNPLSPAIMQNATLAGLASNTRTWEKLETSNVGLDFGVFNSRLTGSFDYFVKNTPNMFYIQEFPEVLGITAPSINGAHVQSKGWEVTLGWNDKIGDWGYFADLNLSNSNSKVIELADSRIPGHGYNGFVEGYPVGSYFGYTFDGIIQTEAELNEYTSRFTSGIPNTLTLGDARFKDLDGDGKLRPQLYELGKDGKPTENSGDLTYIGDEQMHYLFGIRLGASWKFIDFSVFFQGVLKWQRLDDNYPTIADSWPPQHYFWGNYWTENRRDATYPRLSLNGNTNGNNYQTSDAPYKLYNNRYIRLKNIQIGFSIPKNVIEKIKVDKARVYFSGTDVWEWYSIPGVYDPEKPFNPRITPFPRGFSFGLNLTF